LAHNRFPCIPELLHAAGLVPLGGGNLEPPNMVLVCIDIWQYDYAIDGVATGFKIIEEWIAEADRRLKCVVLAPENIILTP